MNVEDKIEERTEWIYEDENENARGNDPEMIQKEKIKIGNDLEEEMIWSKRR